MVEHLRGMLRYCLMLNLHIMNERLLGLVNAKTYNGIGSTTGTAAGTSAGTTGDDRA